MVSSYSMAVRRNLFLMKAAIAVLSLGIPLVTAHAQEPRLLLVPVKTSLKPHSKTSFDVYLLNTTNRPVRAATLDSISISYSWSDVTGKTERAGAASDTKVITSQPAPRLLTSNHVEWKRIEADISAQPGDLVEVHVQIGPPPHLRSNSVLLFCPTK
jgi:hypothetical protein